jgi:hypothetical protein
MECVKCGSNKNLKELFNRKKVYNEIDESVLTEDEKYEFYYMHYEMGKSIDELIEYYKYVEVSSYIIGKLCLTCNELNVIEKKIYYDDLSEMSTEVYDVIYPTKSMEDKYKNNREKIPYNIYDTYIRAREADNKNIDVSVFLLRKTTELLLKDLNLNGNNLNQKIKNLDSDINNIKEGLDRIRDEGNKAVHESDNSLTNEDVVKLADNIETILNLFYTL